jgi:hypothetical protein
MRTENFAGAGRNSPVMQCETGILGGHSVRPSRRLIDTTLNAILILSNTDRIKTHEPGLHRFRFTLGPKSGLARDQRFFTVCRMPDRLSKLASVECANHAPEADMDRATAFSGFWLLRVWLAVQAHGIAQRRIFR